MEHETKSGQTEVEGRKEGGSKRGRGFPREWGYILTYLLCVNIVGQHEKSSERRVANGVAGFMSILVFLFPALKRENDVSVLFQYRIKSERQLTRRVLT